jgi:NADPH-dependent 2,4-dienoyl-CoA reductase/sulfur reductase-like enzyme
VRGEQRRDADLARAWLGAVEGERVTERLVVVGGDAAGMSSASQARRLRGPDELEIVAFERGGYTSYSACGIPYLVGGTVTELERLITRAPQTFRKDYAIDARVRHEVTEIDLDRGAVKVRALDEGTESWEGFDEIVVATGAVPLRPSLPGADAGGVFGVQTLDHGVAIKKYVESTRPRRAVVIGGGYIGLEMAEAFKANDMDVTLVEMAPEPMSSLDPEMGGQITSALRDMGITVHTEEPVTGFETERERVRAVVTEQRTIPAEIVVLGLGVRPATELGRSAGITVGTSGGFEVDRRMRTSRQQVWAAGDCAEKWHRVARRPVAIPLGTHANKEGRVAGINIGGGYATFPGVIGTAASRVCDLEVARTGLKESDALSAGFEPVSVMVDSTTRAGYLPGASPIKTKLTVERRTGRVLGAQIVGREGAAKRIDALAVALWNSMTVDELLNLDLAYAPPFSPVWDPILIAARKAWQKVEEGLPNCP